MKRFKVEYKTEKGSPYIHNETAEGETKETVKKDFQEQGFFDVKVKQIKK